MRVSICKSMFGIPLSLYIPLLFFSLCIFIFFLCVSFLILFSPCICSVSARTSQVSASAVLFICSVCIYLQELFSLFHRSAQHASPFPFLHPLHPLLHSAQRHTRSRGDWERDAHTYAAHTGDSTAQTAPQSMQILCTHRIFTQQ